MTGGKETETKEIETKEIETKEIETKEREVCEQVADSFFNAKGEVLFGLTNDYMFKAVMERNKTALKGLICSLLHMTPEEVIDVYVLNANALGNSVESKDMVLDIKVCLDNNTFINLEMQLARQDFWPERSLVYLCRTFDHLKEGENYLATKPAIHIGFVDFDLFREEPPEFYATYHLANDKTHRIYTSKFTLSVVNLKRIDAATQEDKEHKIDYWARLFKSTTWEEIQMLAKENNAIAEAAQTMYELSDDELVRERCRARQEHYRILQTYEEQAKEQRRILQTYEEQAAEQRRILQSYEDQIKEQADAIEEQAKVMQEQADAIEEQTKVMQEQADALKEKDALIAKLQAQLEARKSE